MKRLLRAVLAAGLSVSVAPAQTFASPGCFAMEISLENSAWPRLAMHRSAITSLAVAGDYAIGGTTAEEGLSPYVFAASLSRRKLEMIVPLEQAVAGQRAIPGGFASAADGTLYAGTLPAAGAASGHLIRVTIRGTQLAVTDLGAPVRGEGIFTVALDEKRQMLYALTYPTGRFLRFHLTDGKVMLCDDTAPDKIALKTLADYRLDPRDYLSRRLTVDRAGRVFGSAPLGGLFRFDPETGRITVWPDALPSIAGHQALARVDAWAVAPDGTIYGSNAGDGQLFTLNAENGTVVNLGQAASIPRLQGMAFGAGGTLYGVTGGVTDYAQVFTYSAMRGFVDLGSPVCPMASPGIEQGIPWRGFHFGSVAASADRQYIVLGEDEALSQLMVLSARQ